MMTYLEIYLKFDNKTIVLLPDSPVSIIIGEQQVWRQADWFMQELLFDKL